MKINLHKKGWFTPKSDRFREDWKAEKDITSSKKKRTIYVNEIRRVKFNYYTTMGPKISKNGGFYKVLQSRNKIGRGYAIKEPISNKFTSDDKELSELFMEKFSTKTSALIDYTKLELIIFYYSLTFYDAFMVLSLLLSFT